MRCNGVPATFQRVETALKPGPDTPVYRFAATLDSPEAVIEARPNSPGRVEWAEAVLETP